MILLPLLSVDFPSNAQMYCDTLSQLISFKFFNVDHIMDYISGSSNEKGQESDLDHKFKSNGFPTKNILKNVGLLILSLLVICSLIIFLLILKFFFRKTSCAFKFYDALEKILIFNALLRNQIQSYLSHTLSTLYAISTFDKDDTKQSTGQVISLIYTIMFPLFITICL